MNAFEQYEVWFVTGAQLLYGGDAVIAVDAHSNEMVKGLNEMCIRDRGYTIDVCRGDEAWNSSQVWYLPFDDLNVEVTSDLSLIHI